MDINLVFKEILGPWGATFLLLVAVIFLWKELKASQEMVSRQQDLFEEAIRLMRDDIVPMARPYKRR
jgi:hypothetical protein